MSNNRPTGIVRTLISEDGKGREQFDQAIAALDRGDIPSVFIALQAAPKHNVLHLYLLIEGRIELRLNIAEYLPGTSERCWDGVERAPKFWAVCTGPVSRPPEPIKRLGFQGLGIIHLTNLAYWSYNLTIEQRRFDQCSKTF